MIRARRDFYLLAGAIAGLGHMASGQEPVIPDAQSDTPIARSSHPEQKERNSPDSSNAPIQSVATYTALWCKSGETDSTGNHEVSTTAVLSRRDMQPLPMSANSPTRTFELPYSARCMHSRWPQAPPISR